MNLARLASGSLVLAAVACGAAESSAPPPAPAGAPPAAAAPAPAATCAPGPPVCHPDGRAIVTFCGAQATLVQRCAGPRGCTTTAQGPTCDESVARAGDPCRAEGGFACSDDGGAMLQCARGRQVVASTCKGPRRCAIGERVACDSSTADPSDPCADEGRMACSRDGRTLFKCTRGAFVADQACARMACMISGSSVLCQ